MSPLDCRLTPPKHSACERRPGERVYGQQHKQRRPELISEHERHRISPKNREQRAQPDNAKTRRELGAAVPCGPQSSITLHRRRTRMSTKNNNDKSLDRTSYVSLLVVLAATNAWFIGAALPYAH